MSAECIICKVIDGELATPAAHVDPDLGLVCRECSQFLRRRVAPALHMAPGIAAHSLAGPRNSRRRPAL